MHRVYSKALQDNSRVSWFFCNYCFCPLLSFWKAPTSQTVMINNASLHVSARSRQSSLTLLLYFDQRLWITPIFIAVGQFRDIVEVAEKDPQLCETLKKVLKLTRGWEIARDHARTAVSSDNRMRIWCPQSGSQVSPPQSGLLFKCHLGSVDMENPVGETLTCCSLSKWRWWLHAINSCPHVPPWKIWCSQIRSTVSQPSAAYFLAMPCMLLLANSSAKEHTQRNLEFCKKICHDTQKKRLLIGSIKQLRQIHYFCCETNSTQSALTKSEVWSRLLSAQEAELVSRTLWAKILQLGDERSWKPRFPFVVLTFNKCPH